MPAEKEKGCQIECNTGPNGEENCELVCGGSTATSATQVTNIDQCMTGRNKCSENAACKDLEDEVNENNELIRKLRFVLTITDSFYSSNVQLPM